MSDTVNLSPAQRYEQMPFYDDLPRRSTEEVKFENEEPLMQQESFDTRNYSIMDTQ